MSPERYPPSTARLATRLDRARARRAAAEAARLAAEEAAEESRRPIRGEKGDTGEPGPVGPVGPVGPKGDPGEPGEPGESGSDGRDGVPGPPGEPGAPGTPGKDGSAGRDGKDGEPGPGGIQGARGPKGEKGEPGEAGADGYGGGIGPGVESVRFVSGSESFMVNSVEWPAGSLVKTRRGRAKIVFPAAAPGGGGGGTAAPIAWNEVPSGAVDSSNPTFTLAQGPDPVGAMMLFKNGILQRVGSGNDFTISGTTITFLAGNIPQTDDILACTYQW